MRKLLLICLAVVVLTAGCKRMSKSGSKTTASPGSTSSSSDGPSVHGSTGVVLNPGVGGGGGGAAQAVRKAAMSAVTRNEMHDLHLLIENASGGSDTGQLPSKTEIMGYLQQARSPVLKKIQDGSIVLTGARSRESIWAYTKEAQNNGGHFILSSSGIENLSADALQQRLRQEGFQ